MKRPILSKRQIVVAIAFGIAAAIISFLIKVPVEPDMYMDPAEIFVSLGSAFGGPIAGLIIGFIYGIYAYVMNGFASGVRNMPSHMLVGFVWGIWYIYLWKFTVDRKNGKWIRIALWTIAMPVYYYVLLLPLHSWIHATVHLNTPFIPLFMKVAPMVLPEMILTIMATDIILAVLPDKYAAPVK